MFLRLHGIAAVLLAAYLSGPAGAQPRTEVVTVNMRPPVTMKYLEVRGSAQPTATVILFAGGNGVLDLQDSGEIRSPLRMNFLIRSRELFVNRGLVVAAVDAASDMAGGMNGNVRLSAQHAQDIAKVIATARQRLNAPVWVVGTSAGTLSAAGVASRLTEAGVGPDGVVLTATQTQLVSGLCGRTVHNAALAAITRPVLAVSHRNDGCPCSPGTAAAGTALMEAFGRASPKRFDNSITGGSPPASSDPCTARTQHGFFGVESQAVQLIANWIANPRPGK